MIYGIGMIFLLFGPKTMSWAFERVYHKKGRAGMIFVTKEFIPKGWSQDKKYRVTDEEGKHYLLRIMPHSDEGSVKLSHETMKRVEAQGVPMCRSLEYGVCEEGPYQLQTWIHGEDAEEIIPTLSEAERYHYGYEAGQIARRIHQIPAPEGIEDWESRFNRKASRKIQMYQACPLRYEGGDAFIEYIEHNRHLLKDRPQTYQHGDYHVGNMMIDSQGQLQIIDFNRDDYGDPWEEFNRIVWCAQVSPRFASGMVDGYFDGQVPMLFWQLLAFYISSNALSSLPWAIPFGEKQIQVMMKQGAEILQWYDGMKQVVPSWYHKGKSL